MPELPEVETVKNTLKKKILNQKINDVNIFYNKIIEYPTVDEFKEQILNQTINDIKRRGKWLMFELDNYYLLSHLRMEGRYYIKNKSEAMEKHAHICFLLDNDMELRYIDARKFGKMHLIKKEDILKRKPINELGYEPWDRNLNIKYLKEKYAKRNIPIKTVILDQGIIVGIGNIYADEILFLSNISPLKKANQLNDTELQNIIDNTKKVLEHAIVLGGTTIKSYESSEGVHGKFQNELLIHNKKTCPKCNSNVEKIRVGGRGTYFCKNCQK